MWIANTLPGLAFYAVLGQNSGLPAYIASTLLALSGEAGVWLGFREELKVRNSRKGW